MTRRLLACCVALVALALVPVAISGCGGPGSGSNLCQPHDVKVGLSEYKFTPARLTVAAGKTTFCLSNHGVMEHNLTIGNASGTQTLDQSDTLAPGQVSRFTVTLKPGSYMTWCSIPGHRQQGMVGGITVT